MAYIINKYKLATSLVLVPLYVFNPISGGYPVGFGGWGVDIWPKLVVLLLMYILIYHYLYFIFWNIVEEKVYKCFDLVFYIFGGFNLDQGSNVTHLEDIIIFVEYICYHYFLYFLFIM